MQMFLIGFAASAFWVPLLVAVALMRRAASFIVDD